MNRILSSQGIGLDQAVGRTSARLVLAVMLAGAAFPSQALEDSTRLNAVNATITGNQACTGLSKFYWEIGDKVGGVGHVWSGTGGGTGTAPTASQQIPIYSAGKWFWGAYAYERLGGLVFDGTPHDKFLTMHSGFDARPLLYTCAQQDTVESCRASMPKFQQAKQDSFFYGSGHFQNHAVSAAFKAYPTLEGLGPLNKEDLATEMQRVLGTDIVLSYNAPQLAGGAKSSATDYAKFLRKILNAQLRMGSGLGDLPVCTSKQVESTCLVGYSPVNDPLAGLQEPWHYSLGHWLEDAPGIGDRAFSSPGAAGFYPWIDASKTYYGILARNVVGTTSAGNSVKCGRKIRAAWLTGNQQ